MKILDQLEILGRVEELSKRIQKAYDKCSGTVDITPHQLILATLQRTDFLILEHNKSIAIISVESRTAINVLSIIVLEGENKELKSQYKLLEKLAKEFKCAYIEFQGRSGWQKVFDDFKTETIYSKRII